MPNLAELNVIVGGDVKPLEVALNNAKKGLVSFAGTAKAIADLKPFSAATAGAIEAAKSVDVLKNTLAQLKIEQASVTNPQELLAYNNAIEAVTTEIKALTTASGQAGGASEAFSSAFDQVRQLAYILPGIGIAGIFSAAFEAIAAAAKEMNFFASQSELVTEAIKEQNDAFAQSAGNVAKELTQMQALVQAGRDETLTREQRNNAIKELQRIYPGVLENITAENIGSQQATIAINSLTDAIVRKSKAEAIAGLISKTQAQIYELQNKPLEENLKMLDYIKASLMNAGSGSISLVTDAIKNQQTNLTELNTLLDGYIKNLNEVTVEQAKAGDFGKFVKPATAKDIKTISDVLAELKNRLSLIGAEENVFGTNLDPERINAIKSAITSLLGIKVSGTSDTVQALIDQMKTLQDNIDNARRKLDLFLLKGGDKGPGKAPATGNPVVPLLQLGEDSNKVFEKAEEKGKAAIEKMKKTLEDALRNTFEDVAVSVGESLGALFSGKTNPFEALGKTLGNAIKALGAQLIKLGTTAAVIQEALSKLFSGPGKAFALIAGGIALTAIGSAISNLGVTPHAEGGIFDKPTMIGSHLFGEKGPEVLLPLGRLQSMLGGMGNGQNIQVNGTIGLGYDKLLVAIQRADKYTGRNYGNFNNG